MFKKAFILGLGIIVFYTVPLYAQVGDFGFFGGISQGRKLPKTTEEILEDDKNKKDSLEGIYKELIFLDGKPVEFEGMLTTETSTKKASKNSKNAGTFDVSYTVEAGNATAEGVNIDRELSYEINYREEGNQEIRDYEVDSWQETITTPDGTYNLDEDQSYSSISVLIDKTPGVSYYRGDISQRGVYFNGETKYVMETSGSFYGYDSAWSSTETHRIDTTITTNDWQTEYQLRPSVSVSKVLQYGNNEPTATSFRGNYREVIQNKSGLSYNIYVLPNKYTYSVEKSGSIAVDVFNSFEQLIAPDVSFLKGHFAEDDIKKLFSMQVLEGEPKFYQPDQAITRGQYVQALAKAVKLPVDKPTSGKSPKKGAVIDIIFPDVLPEKFEYPYIMAAYKYGLAVGRDNGQFYVDSPIQRQEAIVILMRTLGLENLGLEPTPITSFTDDEQIADWAKKEVYAANRLGIISGDINGKFRPKDYVSKAEASAFVNRLITYMRSDLQTDYTEHIVNYAD